MSFHIRLEYACWQLFHFWIIVKAFDRALLMIVTVTDTVILIIFPHLGQASCYGIGMDLTMYGYCRYDRH